jgi:DinB superfamily
MTTAQDNPKVGEILNSIQNSYIELNQLLNGPLAALDSSKLYQVPAENEWTILQNLAHTVEFMPYWANEVEMLVAEPGRNFGRTAQDERRLRGISDHEADTLAQIQVALPGSYARLFQVLSTLKDSDLALTGNHVKYGNQTLEWFIEEFITRHLSGHVQQIKVALAAVE